MGYSLPGSSLQAISQARIVKWIPISSFRESSQCRDQTHIPCIGRRILNRWATKEVLDLHFNGIPVALVVKNLFASAGDVGDSGSLSRLGRSPGEGNGTPLQYSCLENPTDRGAWWATVHAVAKSRTRLNDFNIKANHTIV